MHAVFHRLFKTRDRKHVVENNKKNYKIVDNKDNGFGDLSRETDIPFHLALSEHMFICSDDIYSWLKIVCVTRFVSKQPLYKEPTCKKAEIFKELILLKTKSHRNFPIKNFFK